MIEQFDTSLVSINNDIVPPYAKGIGNPNKPIDMRGTFIAKAGQKYSSHVGYDTLILSKQCGVSIADTPIVLFPERTAFIVSEDTEILFDRDIILIMSASNTTSYPESGETALGRWTKFSDGTLIQTGRVDVEFKGSYWGGGNITYPLPFIDSLATVTASCYVPHDPFSILKSVHTRSTFGSWLGCHVADYDLVITRIDSYAYLAIGRWKVY